MMESRAALAGAGRYRQWIRLRQMLSVSALLTAMFATITPASAMDSAGSDIYCEPPTEGRPAICYEFIEVTAPTESVNAPSVPVESDGGDVGGGDFYDGGIGGGRVPRVSPDIQFRIELDNMSTDELIKLDREMRDAALGGDPADVRRSQAVTDELLSRGCSYTLNVAVDRVWTCPFANS